MTFYWFVLLTPADPCAVLAAYYDTKPFLHFLQKYYQNVHMFVHMLFQRVSRREFGVVKVWVQ